MSTHTNTPTTTRTEPVVTYVIRPGHAADGTPWWTIVTYEDNRPLGGDHHWLTEALAITAKARYEREGHQPQPKEVAEV